VVGVAILNAADGDLDLTFGTGGKVMTSFPGISATGRAMAVDGRGRIVVVGEGFSALDPELLLARYNPDGTLDTTFGANGMVVGDGFMGNSVAIDRDGRIVVVGWTRARTFWFDTSIARFLDDGTPDTSFGVGGRVLTPCDFFPLTGLVIDDGGRILMAGSSVVANRAVFCLVRYNSDGSPDAAFGTGGYATAAFSTHAFANDLALGPGGGVTVAGIVFADSTYERVGVARFTNAGTLDTSFGNLGTVEANLGVGDDAAWDVAIDDQGRTVVVGESITDPNRSDSLVARFTANGTLDSDFNGTGWAFVGISDESGHTSALAGIAIDRDGRIVGAGTVSDALGTDFALVRLNVDGSPDASFGANGIVRTDYEQGFDHAAAVAVDADGTILVAGSAGNIATGESRFGLARYGERERHYSFNGFFAPIDNAPAFNLIKAGRAVPVKFSLNGAQGLGILAPGSPTSHSIACQSAASPEVVPDMPTMSTNSLTYDPVADQYTYVWKTDRAWADSCRQLVLTLDDGSTHVANFKLSK
jgi:uncharacterized delta-60 repeat protein